VIAAIMVALDLFNDQFGIRQRDRRGGWASKANRG